MTDVSIPLRKGRRRTSLPTPPQDFKPSTDRAVSDALHQLYVKQIRFNLSKSLLFEALGEPDPWDDAVRWIEQRHAARAEWDWPEPSVVSYS